MRCQRFNQIERRQNLLSMAAVARTETRKRQRRAILMRSDLSNDPAFVSDADMIAEHERCRVVSAPVRPLQCARFASLVLLVLTEIANCRVRGQKSQCFLRQSS